ncbi:MAG: N(4)-(beta-N-acetylglucosaminyl)-L-asparaginase [Bacteroidota bacterium]
MSTTRRKFLGKSILSTLGLTFGGFMPSSCSASTADQPGSKFNTNMSSGPVVISTWNNFPANAVAMGTLQNGGSALNAVEQGVRVVEADPNDTSVGYGGLPDREGNVTLDACIMDSNGNCGAVCYLKNIMHPISVARKVMENTPHVLLAGDGALQFALSSGFEREDLLTPSSRAKWEEWKKKSIYAPKINSERHDTIGMLAIDEKGDIAGACTTSGLAYKLPGRVGDSPIIGAGLFVDNEIGGAVATGMGEAVLKSVGTFLVVELMRQGMSPEAACKEAVMRIVRKQKFDDIQVGYIAVNKKGEYGAFCIQSGFNYSYFDSSEQQLNEATYYMKRKED